MVHQLTFECFKKALGHRIVPTVAFATHTLHDRQALQLIPEFSAGVLHPAIRMEEQFAVHPPVFESHTPRCHARISRFKAITQGPADYFPVR